MLRFITTQTSRRVALVASAAMAALMLVPAASLAQTTKFGSNLNREPANSLPAHTCDTSGQNNPTPTCTRVGVQYMDGGAVNGHITAPISGWITKIKLIAGGPGSLRVRVVRLHNLDLGQHTADGQARARSQKLYYQGHGFDPTNKVESFNVHLRVHKGDYLGIDSSSTSAVACTQGSTTQLIFSPKLVNWAPFTPASDYDDCTLLVQAKIHS